NLIVSFYAAYVSAVLVPFVAYLLAQLGRYTFSPSSVRLSLVMSSISASSVLILTLINPSLVVFGNVELNIMIIGILLGVLGLLMGQVIEKYFPASQVKEEI
ncbi:hypothetical protein NDI49_30865, partial [Trichocoleus sp. ST-U3]